MACFSIAKPSPSQLSMQLLERWERDECQLAKKMSFALQTEQSLGATTLLLNGSTDTESSILPANRQEACGFAVGLHGPAGVYLQKQRPMSTTTIDDRSGTDLLLAFCRVRDEAAFEALARRHVDMILSVSLRRSGNRQLAEEATQNVLVSLSIKAQKLAVLENSLSGWLHTATKFEVAKLQRRDFRSIGEALGISEDTAQKRTSRAFERLTYSLSERQA
jgi:hypothetical protein